MRKLTWSKKTAGIWEAVVGVPEDFTPLSPTSSRLLFAVGDAQCVVKREEAVVISRSHRHRAKIHEVADATVAVFLFGIFLLPFR